MRCCTACCGFWVQERSGANCREVFAFQTWRATFRSGSVPANWRALRVALRALPGAQDEPQGRVFGALRWHIRSVVAADISVPLPMSARALRPGAPTHRRGPRAAPSSRNEPCASKRLQMLQLSIIIGPGARSSKSRLSLSFVQIVFEMDEGEGSGDLHTQAGASR